MEEGLIDPNVGSGRHWKVAVSTRGQAVAADKVKAAAEKQERRENTEADRVRKVVEFLTSKPDGETAAEIKNRVGVNDRAWKPLLAKMLTEGVLVECRVPKRRQSYPGFCLA